MYIYLDIRYLVGNILFIFSFGKIDFPKESNEMFVAAEMKYSYKNIPC